MLNEVKLIGHLGQDPESRTSHSGMMICRLSVATNERVKKGDNWEDHTEWHRVTCFGRTAENVQKYLAKGSKVYVSGKLRTSKWQDKNGNDRWTTEILANDVKFLDSKGGGGGSHSRTARERSWSDRSSAGAVGGGELDDDIPF